MYISSDETTSLKLGMGYLSWKIKIKLFGAIKMFQHTSVIFFGIKRNTLIFNKVLKMFDL